MMMTKIAATTTGNRDLSGSPITSLELEDAADRLIRDWPDEVALYSERGLMRKIRDQDRRIPEVDETACRKDTIDYLVRQQARLLISSAHLTKVEAAIITLLVEGWDIPDISVEFGISYDRVTRSVQRARAKLDSGGCRYAGLYEVYWSEVHRYVYRAPTSRLGRDATRGERD